MMDLTHMTFEELNALRKQLQDQLDQEAAREDKIRIWDLMTNIDYELLSRGDIERD